MPFAPSASQAEWGSEMNVQMMDFMKPPGTTRGWAERDVHGSMSCDDEEQVKSMERETWFFLSNQYAEK